MHVVRRVVFSHGRGRTQKHFNGITSKHIINQGIRRCFQPTNNYRFTTAVTTYSRERELDTFSQESLYPTAVRPTLDISSYIQTHKEIEDGSRHKDTPSTVLCGRITSFRESSKNLYFYTISDGLSSVQVLADKRHYASPAQFNNLAMQTDENIDSRLFEFQTLHGIIQRGDLIAVDGFPGKTKRGELSIVARQVRLLAPCLMDIPAGRGDGKYALKDKHTRYQNRYLDLLANRDNLKLFRMRSEILDEVRTFFRSRGFMSVETPVLCKSAGGATARPFKTVLNAEQRNLELRIAPELYLKKLVVGGFEKVYEMGTVFRNEGLDHTHNPEFTMCEAYQAHADYTDMMDLTEQLLRHVSQTVCGSTKVQVAECTIDFSQPFQRIPIISGLEQELGMEPGTFPKLDDDDESQLRELRNLCVKHAGVSESDAAKMNGAKLCDGLIAAILEPKCIQPTFLMDHPVAMSPLAKRHRSDSSLTERFELFVLGRELCNSYSELNEPREQKLRFEHQRQVRLRSGSNDHDADAITSEFCDALEYGLPPTAGWGMGIDRLVMLLTGQSSIRDVILFPVV